MNYLSKRVLAVVGLGALIAAGAITADAASGAGGTPSDYTAVAPVRVLDTRVAPSTAVAALGTQVVAFPVADVPAGATAVTVNVTVTAPKAAGYLIVDPDGMADPKGTSNLNFTIGQTTANEATVPVGADGKIQITNESPGSVQLIVDVEGYYTAAPAAYTAPTPIVETVSADATPVGTGGSFLSRATDLSDFTVPAGTYQVSENLKATPLVQGNTATIVYPSFHLYNQAVSASFTGDVLDTGGSPLESGTATNADQWFNGSGVLVLDSATTFHLYGFGYDSDTGEGTYTFDGGTVTFVPVGSGS